MHDLLLDVRFALRTLRKHKVLSLVAVLSLAIGIGANSTTFGMIDAILLHPLNYPDSSRLVCLPMGGWARWVRRPRKSTLRLSSTPRGIRSSC